MRRLFVALVLAIAFVLGTGDSLPPMVATHFIAGGAANGFMPLAMYFGFTITVLVGLPLFIALLSGSITLLPTRFINLPDREYWLAPERQADTLLYLRKQGHRFGLLLILFLCFIHWLVVVANAYNPPHFPESWFFIGLTLFLISLAFWVGRFIFYFRRRL